MSKPKRKTTRTTRIDRSAPDWDTILAAVSSDIRVTEYRASVNAVADATAQADPFRVLIATIISLRTRDEVTLPAAERLISRAGTPEELAALSIEEIESLIYPAGFYHTKAKTIQRVSRIISENYHGSVPSTIEQLTELPGVGRKTANLVLALGFGIPAICVDTHVHRVANRMGWVDTKTPEATERSLEKMLPLRYWIPINQWLVAFGRIICTPGRPRCSICPVYEHCVRAGVSRSR